jgi:hypothetical protein
LLLILAAKSIPTGFRHASPIGFHRPWGNPGYPTAVV